MRPDRLLRHDRLIAVNTIRATFAGWGDRMIAATMLLVLLVAIGATMSDRAWPTDMAMAATIGVLAGLAAAKVIGRRLSFHGTDGVLAADAWAPASRHRYVGASHGVGLAAFVGVALVAGPPLGGTGALGYLAGASLGALAARVEGVRAGAARGRWLRTARRRLHTPEAGAVAAILLILSLLPTVGMAARVQLGIIGVVTALLASALTTLDHATVRFMTIAGQGIGRIVARHASSGSVFAAVAAPAAWARWGVNAGGVVLAAVAVMMLIMAARVQVYRLYDKRMADVLVSIMIGVIVLTGFTMIVATPLVAALMAWRLHHRAAARTWLLA